MCCSRKRCWCRCRSAACSIEGEGGLSDIVISEFMDEAAVAGLGVRFSVLYDPALVDNAEALMAASTVDIPAIVLSGGPMLDGWHEGDLAGSGPVIWRMRRKLAAALGRASWRERVCQSV